MLDTTVLAYAAGGEHPLRGDCARLVEAVAEAQLDATTTVEVIQEFAHVHGRRRDRRLAAELANAYATGLAPLLQTDVAVLERGLAIWEGMPSLGAFDAVLAAAALEASADALVSADAAFAGVDGLRHVAPGTGEFDALLAQ